jgi:hypothetical protein
MISAIEYFLTIAVISIVGVIGILVWISHDRND